MVRKPGTTPPASLVPKYSGPLLLAGLLVIFIFYYFQKKNNHRSNLLECEKLKSQVIKGTVAHAFFNEDINVKAFQVRFTNGEYYTTPVFLKSLNGVIEPGDSLFKPAGIFEFHIYKKYSGKEIVHRDTVLCNDRS